MWVGVILFDYALLVGYNKEEVNFEGAVMVDKATQQQLDVITDIIKETLPVEQIYLFGSYATGTPHQDSDLDLYVVMKDSADIREIDAMGLIHKAISGKKSIPVDVLVGKKQKYMQRSQGLTIEKTIADQGVLLYG